MDKFNLQLDGQLDQENSKKKINSDLVTIAKAIEKLKVQAEIDPNSVKNIAQQLANIINQKVVIDNIQINTNKVSKTGSQAAQTFGNSFSQNLQSSLNTVKNNIENTIKGFSNQKLNSYDLSKMFNLNRADIDGSVIQQVRNLTNELNSLAKEVLKTNSDNSWEGIINKINSLSDVLSKFGSARDLEPFKESLEVLNYFQNKKIFVGDKSEALANTGLSIKELNNQFRNLGITFTTVSKGATRLDVIWDDLFTLSPNLQNFDTFGDQINAIVEHFKIAKEALYGDSNLQPLNGSEVNKVLVDWASNLENTSKKVSVFREEQAELEKQIAQSSSTATNTIIQNEEKKQQAYRETTQAQKQLYDGKSLIESDAGNSALTSIQNMSTAVTDVRNHFKELLGDEEAVVTSLKNFNGNELDSFTVNVKRASGEVESLNYKIKDSSIWFDSGKINDSGAIKQVEQIERKYTEFYNKLNDLKSSFSETSFNASGFEKLLNDFRNGEISANKLSVAFNELKNTAQTLKKMLNSQDSSFDTIQQTLNNMRDLPNLIKNVETGMGNLKDKTSLTDVSVKDLFSTYNSLKSEMDSTGGKVPLTDEWITKYRELMSAVTSVQNQIDTLKKIEASDNSQATKQANYYSSILSSYRQMYDIKKKLLTAEEEEAKVLEGQRKSISASIAANYKQLGEQGLKDKDWQSQVDVLKKAQEYQLSLTNARVNDKATIQEQTQAQKELASALKEQEKINAQANKIQLSIETGGYESKVESLISRTRQWTDVNGEAKINTDALSAALRNLNTASDNLANNNTITNQQALITAERELKIQIDTVTNSVRKMNAEFAKDSAVTSLHNQVTDFMSKNGKTVKYYGTDLYDILNKTAQGANLTNQEMAVLKQRFIDVQTVARSAGRLGKTWFQTLREGMRSFSYWTSGTFIVMKTVGKIKEAVNFAKELNSALVNINYTMDVTKSQLENIGNKSIDMAKKLHTSAENVLSAVKLYANAKETADSILAKAQPAIMLSNVTGFSGEESAKYLQTIMNQFDLTQDDLMSISDTIQGISQSMAHDFADGIVQINEGISTSGEVARAAGMDLTEYASMIGLLVEKTGLAGSQLGKQYCPLIQ